MIEQQGKVVAVNRGQVCILLGGQAGCSACDAGKGCGAGVFGQMLRRKPLKMNFENRIEAECGQAVVVGLPESLFLRLAVRFYLLPLLAGLVGGLAGHYLAGSLEAGVAVTDLLTLLGAVLCAGLMLWANRVGQTEFSEMTAVHLLRVAGKQEFKKEECV